MPFKSVTQKILEVEESFENIVFWLQGQLGRKQGVSYSLDQVRALSLFDFYKLKNRFIINQSQNGNSE